MTTGRHLDWKKTRALLAWLDDFLAVLGPERGGAFLCRVLGRDDGDGGRALLADIRAARAAGVRARWRGRRRRLLREGSIVQVARSRAGTWRLIKPFTLATAEAALGTHLARQKGEQPEILKEDVKRRLTRVGAGPRSVIVKEYRDAGPLGVFRRDCRSWLNTYHLGLYGIPVARSLAWLRAEDGRGFVLFEDAGKDCLFHRLRVYDCSLPRRPLLRAVAELLASMHAAGALHKDMKTGNFMVLEREGFPHSPLTVIDIDAARFGTNVGTRGRVKNLRQVLETLPPGACVLERLRFLATYARAAGLPRDRTKAFISALAEHLSPA